jgi:hypothetical protein
MQHEESKKRGTRKGLRFLVFSRRRNGESLSFGLKLLFNADNSTICPFE